MMPEIAGQRAKTQHLTQQERMSLLEDLRQNKSIEYLCRTYRISSRVAQRYRSELLFTGTIHTGDGRRSRGGKWA